MVHRRRTSLLRRLGAVQRGVAATIPTAAVETAPFISRRSPVVSINGMAASSEPLVSEVGLRIMHAGGNCIDAAIAMAAAINMCEPTMTGIGGDAFCLYYDKATGSVHGMNASGRAPAALSIDVVTASTGRSYPSAMPSPVERGCQHTVTVPGACAGWCDAVEKWGSGMTMDTILKPAIEMGESGYPIHKLTAAGWQAAAPLLNIMPNGREMLVHDESGDGWRGPREAEGKSLNNMQTTQDVANLRLTVAFFAIQ